MQRSGGSEEERKLDLGWEEMEMEEGTDDEAATPYEWLTKDWVVSLLCGDKAETRALMDGSDRIKCAGTDARRSGEGGLATDMGQLD